MSLWIRLRRVRLGRLFNKFLNYANFVDSFGRFVAIGGYWCSGCFCDYGGL